MGVVMARTAAIFGITLVWAASAIGVAMGGASAQGAGAANLYTVCSSANDQPAVYLSDVFATTGPLANQPRTKAFTEFLAQKYQFKGTVVCNNMALMDAQDFVQSRLYALVAQNKQVFQTGWTFGGAPPAAAPSGIAQPARSSASAPLQTGPVQNGNGPRPYGPYGANGYPNGEGTRPPPAPYGSGPYGSNPYGSAPYGSGAYGAGPYGGQVPCTGYGC